MEMYLRISWGGLSFILILANLESTVRKLSLPSLIKTYKKLFLFSYQLMSQRVGFHFPCRCFERDKISPPFARIKCCVIWHESQMHTGVWSGLFGAPLQRCHCNNHHPHLFWASFAPCFLARGSNRERERPIIKNSLCSQGRLKTGYGTQSCAFKCQPREL